MSDQIFIAQGKDSEGPFVSVTIINSGLENSVDLQTRQALDVSKLIARYAHHGETGRTELSHKIMQTHFHAKMQTRFANRIKRGLEKNEKIITIVDDLLNMAWTEVT